MARVGEEPTPFLVTQFNHSAPRLSPDGRWLAYASDQSGDWRIYVTPFPDGDRVIPISAGSGVQAVWSRDGRELFYRNGSKMMAVRVEPGRDFRTEAPATLFDEPFVLDPPNARLQTYDVSLDGQRFLMVRQDEDAAGQLTRIEYHHKIACFNHAAFISHPLDVDLKISRPWRDKFLRIQQIYLTGEQQVRLNREAAQTAQQEPISTHRIFRFPRCC